MVARGSVERRWAEAWRRRWDRQQERYLPDREERFDAILDALDHSVARGRGRHHGGTKPFRFLDLGCGAGALSERILRRFPGSRGVAVDFDPLLMHLGRTALPDLADRLTWVDADLRSRGWTSRLPAGRVDAVVSTTALHWLSQAELARVYRAVADRLRRGGVLLNGDTLHFDARAPTAHDWARQHRGFDLAHSIGSGESWQEWWTAVKVDPRLATEVRERATRVSARHERVPPVDVEEHARLLRRAGFRETAVVWSHWENRVLLAVR